MYDTILNLTRSKLKMAKVSKVKNHVQFLRRFDWLSIFFHCSIKKYEIAQKCWKMAFVKWTQWLYGSFRLVFERDILDWDRRKFTGIKIFSFAAVVSKRLRVAIGQSVHWCKNISTFLPRKFWDWKLFCFYVAGLIELHNLEI